MNRGKHHKPNAILTFLMRKPVYLSAIALIALGWVATTMPGKVSYAAPSLASYGGSDAVPLGDGGTPQANGSIANGKILYPQFKSPELPSNWQGSGSAGPAEGEMFFDQWGELQGPGGTGGPVPAYIEHFDVLKANDSPQYIQSNSGFNTVAGSMVDSYIQNVDGYQGQGGTTESQFDSLLQSEATSDYSTWTVSKSDFGQTYTAYDLGNLIQWAGGAFSGRYLGNTPGDPSTNDPWAGPLFYWTYAPQAKVTIPPQTIKPGGTLKFDGEAAVQTYGTGYHWEWAQVVDSNGQTVAGATINFANSLGYGSGAYGNGIYVSPGVSSSARMTEVNGGDSDPESMAPTWHYWADGTGESTWGATTPSQYDTIQLPSNLANGTYTLQFRVSDWYNRTSANVATAQFVVGNASTSGITLAVDNTSPNVGQSVNLTATVTTPPASGDTYHIEIKDTSGGTTLGGSTTKDSGNNVNTFSTSAKSTTAITESYTAYLIDTTSGNNVASNQAAVTWSAGSSGGGGTGGGGLCPAPYDKNIYWQSNGNGNETLYWTFDEPYAVYRTVTTCTGPKNNQTCTTSQVFDHCADTLTPMSQYYPASETNGTISGLSYDPGVPGNMWLPISASEWGVEASGNGFWAPMDQQHGWDGFEGGGPSASQISGTVYINGMQYNSYGTGQGTTPWVWARPDSGFGFRMLWTGSPHSLPTSGTVTYTIVNPDGSSKVWTETLVVNSETLQTQGTQMLGLDQPPPFANEWFSAWTQLPKAMSNNELAAWSLASNKTAALNNGAHVNVSISFNTQNAGSINVNVPTMVALFSYPTWFLTHIHSITVGNQTYVGLSTPVDGAN